MLFFTENVVDEPVNYPLGWGDLPDHWKNSDYAEYGLTTLKQP